MTRKASEISKAELVEMIAKLRGVIVNVAFSSSKPTASDYGDMQAVLHATAFDDDLNQGYSTITPKYPVKQIDTDLLNGADQLHYYAPLEPNCVVPLLPAEYDMPTTKIIEENSIRDIEDKENELFRCVPDYAAVFEPEPDKTKVRCSECGKVFMRTHCDQKPDGSIFCLQCDLRAHGVTARSAGLGAVEMKPPKFKSVETMRVVGKGIVKILEVNEYLFNTIRELKDKVLIIDDEEWLVRAVETPRSSVRLEERIGLVVRKWKCKHGYEYDSCPWPITNDPDACEFAHQNAFMDLERKPDLMDQLSNAYIGSVKIYPKARMRRVNCGGEWNWEFHCTLRPIIDDNGNIVEWREENWDAKSM